MFFNSVGIARRESTLAASNDQADELQITHGAMPTRLKDKK
ncbi:MAG: hypothetical protein JWP89_1171 [Schlesneria sp.]|nr:hypothetical protein [Schlesneria sp.]